MQKIYSKTTDDISTLLKLLDWNEDSLMLIENLYDILFEKLDMAISFNEWETGRVFNNQQELKWRKIDDVFHAVYIGEVGINEYDNVEELEEYETVTEGVILWGESAKKHEFEDNEYIELPIPKVLKYPIVSDYRVRLNILKYQKADGELAFYRFLNLVEEK